MNSQIIIDWKNHILVKVTIHIVIFKNYTVTTTKKIIVYKDAYLYSNNKISYGLPHVLSEHNTDNKQYLNNILITICIVVGTIQMVILRIIYS